MFPSALAQKTAEILSARGFEAVFVAVDAGIGIKIECGSSEIVPALVFVDQEMSMVQLSDGTELHILEQWNDAVSMMVEIVEGICRVEFVTVTGNSLLWGPWRRVVVRTNGNEYGFSPRYTRNPKRRGSSFIGVHL